MDFHALLKQASINQAKTEKKLQNEKVKEQELREQQKSQLEAKRKESEAKLKQFKADAVKSKLSYHGMLSSSGQPLTDKAREELAKLSPMKKHVATSSSTSLQPNKTRTKSKSSSPRPVKSRSDSNSHTSNSHTSNSHTSKSHTYKPSSSYSKSQTPPPRLKDAKKAKMAAAPVNFNDLLKIAQKNSIPKSLSNTTSAGPSPVTTTHDSKPTPVGVGKALLNKQRKEENPMNKQAGKQQQQQHDKTHKQITGNAKKNNEKSRNGQAEQVKAKPKTGTNSRFDPDKLPYPEVLLRRKDYSYPEGALQQHRKVPTNPGATQQRQVELKKVNKATKTPQKMKSKSFYGGGVPPPSARLITDSKGGQGRGQLYYKSSWVDEMADYVRHAHVESDEEEDDDMDDFVVDDGDCDDYSSAIRNIFGYDKNKYHMAYDYEDNDSLMESSFAQQQFEEMRSAKIGRMEDAEDLKKEKEMLARKRKKGSVDNPPSKKVKY
jgi:protein SPT2